jgi:NADH-quinone oxidoreductase subunit A
MTPLAAYLLLFTIVGIGFIFAHLVAGKLIRPSKPDAEKGTIYECGEPTIGSAWVQFDLRFYVVALLFVIFDVEVAFFFPWAEVFGKANAVATAKKPETAEEYVAYAAKVQDLALPPDPERPGAPPPKEPPPHKRYAQITGRQQDGRPVLDADGKPVGALDAAGLENLRQEQERARARQQAVKGNVKELTDAENVALLREGALKKGEYERNSADASSVAWGALIELLVFFGVLLVGFAYLWRRGDLEWVRSTAAERMEGRTTTTSAPAAPARETAGTAGPR